MPGRKQDVPSLQALALGSTHSSGDALTGLQGGFGAIPLTIWRFPAFLMTPKLTGILQSEFYLGIVLETLQQ